MKSFHPKIVPQMSVDKTVTSSVSGAFFFFFF